MRANACRFDLVVDKGTLDIMLTKEDGWQRAVRTIKWIYSRMRTPGTLMVVSHSPPDERIDLLSTVYWHSIIFKVSAGTGDLDRGPHHNCIQMVFTTCTDLLSKSNSRLSGQ